MKPPGRLLGVQRRLLWRAVFERAPPGTLSAHEWCMGSNRLSGGGAGRGHLLPPCHPDQGLWLGTRC